MLDTCCIKGCHWQDEIDHPNASEESRPTIPKLIANISRSTKEYSSVS